jgi:DNA (cytosine-5)-methyltransferase 1
VKKRLSVVDLFAGAGGLSEGFHRHGFNMVAYVEKDKYACETLLTRHIYWELRKKGHENVYYDYLKGLFSKKELYNFFNMANPVINAEISETMLSQIIKSIREKLELLHLKLIDVFIGGPPCQAYSLVGRARDPYNMKDDPRNILYKYYVALLKEFRPQMFIFENVPGVLSAGKGKLWEDIQLYFMQAGYKIVYNILDASDYMVLQKRKRVILIGWRKNLKLSYPDFNITQHNYLVRDILTDLPPLKPGENVETTNYISEPSEYLIKAGIRTENDILIQHTTRPLNETDRKIYEIAINLWRTNRHRLKYGELPAHLKTHKTEQLFKDRFKVVADNLSYAHTLVAHIAKDGHYYIHPDKRQLRSISVREAARIQSFPDNYKFEGSRTAQLRQIGNAVPPLMAEIIGRKVKEML